MYYFQWNLGDHKHWNLGCASQLFPTCNIISVQYTEWGKKSDSETQKERGSCHFLPPEKVLSA